MSTAHAFPIPAERVRFFQDHQACREHVIKQRDAEKYEIGGSLIGLIIGLKPFGRTAWHAYVELNPHYDMPVPDERLQAIFDRGKEWEPIVLDKYRRVTGNRVVNDHFDHLIEDLTIEEMPGGQVVQVEGPEPWMVATPDAFVANDNDGWGGGEAKTSTDGSYWGESGQVIEEWGPEWEEVVPSSYACQCYWYMLCTGMPYWDLSVMISRAGDFPELRWYRLLAHDQTMSEIHEKVAEWRYKHLIEGEPPDIDESDAARQFLIRRFPGPGPGQPKVVREADADEIALIAEYKHWKNTEAEAKARKEDYRNQITMRIGDDYGIQYGPGKKKALWMPTAGRTSINAARLQERWPEAYDDCAVPGEPTRRFRVFG